MTSDHVTPEHTSLPMHLVDGYIGGYLDTQGFCATQAAFMLAAEHHTTDKAQARALQKLFWEVFLAKRGGEPIPQLNREQLFLLYEGLLHNYGLRGAKLRASGSSGVSSISGFLRMLDTPLLPVWLTTSQGRVK